MNNVYRVNVALQGDVRHVIVKNGVTVPELAMLRHIHSDTAVNNICLTGKEDYDSASERERLSMAYKPEKVVELFRPYGELPMEIKKLNIPDTFLEPGAEPIGKFPKGGKKKVKKQVTKHMEIAEEVADDEPVEAV